MWRCGRSVEVKRKVEERLGKGQRRGMKGNSMGREGLSQACCMGRDFEEGLEL